MKTKILLLLAVFLSTSAIAQKDNRVVIGTIDSIQSKILNEQRKVWVYVPNAEKNFAGTTLYLGIANTMSEGMDIQKVQADTLTETRHIRSILNLDKQITSQKQNGLRYESKYYNLIFRRSYMPNYQRINKSSKNMLII